MLEGDSHCNSVDPCSTLSLCAQTWHVPTRLPLYHKQNSYLGGYINRLDVEPVLLKAFNTKRSRTY
jgi:hypothetical protein